MDKPTDRSEEYERATRAAPEKVHLKLYVAGMGPRSIQAVTDIEALCKTYGDLCSLEIIDVYDQPATLREAQIVAVPALVRTAPLPVRKLIGSVGNLMEAARRLGLSVAAPGAKT